MRKTVNSIEMLNYLKEEWKRAHHLLEVLGHNDERAQSKADWCIGLKEMTEALICEPVNLKLDGRLTVGLDDREVEV